MAKTYRGITEVGHVDGSTDVPWGKTGEDGITISHAATRESLFSGQDLAEVDSAVTRVEASVQVRLIEATAENLARILGLPESAVDDMTDTLTVLADEIGTEEFHLYAIQPGPDGPRRFDFPRARIAQPGDLNISKTAWTLPESTFAILTPSTGELWTLGPAV